jgi:hypothetical protein
VRQPSLWLGRDSMLVVVVVQECMQQRVAAGSRCAAQRWVPMAACEVLLE